MTHDQFTKLYGYMTTRFDEIDAKLETKADKTVVNTLVHSMDYVIKLLETRDIERLAQNAQLDRHEERITTLEKVVA